MEKKRREGAVRVASKSLAILSSSSICLPPMTRTVDFVSWLLLLPVVLANMVPRLLFVIVDIVYTRLLMAAVLFLLLGLEKVRMVPDLLHCLSSKGERREMRLHLTEFSVLFRSMLPPATVCPRSCFVCASNQLGSLLSPLVSSSYPFPPLLCQCLSPEYFPFQLGS